MSTCKHKWKHIKSVRGFNPDYKEPTTHYYVCRKCGEKREKDGEPLKYAIYK